jgi:hypothetical protein
MGSKGARNGGHPGTAAKAQGREDIKNICRGCERVTITHAPPAIIFIIIIFTIFIMFNTRLQQRLLS